MLAIFMFEAPVNAVLVIKLVPDTAPFITKDSVVMLVKPDKTVVTHVAVPAVVWKVPAWTIPVAVKLPVLIAAVLTMFVEFIVGKVTIPVPVILERFTIGWFAKGVIGSLASPRSGVVNFITAPNPDDPALIRSIIELIVKFLVGLPVPVKSVPKIKSSVVGMTVGYE